MISRPYPRDASHFRQGWMGFARDSAAARLGRSAADSNFCQEGSIDEEVERTLRPEPSRHCPKNASQTDGVRRISKRRERDSLDVRVGVRLSRARRVARQ